VGCDNGPDVVCGAGTHLDTDGVTCVEDADPPAINCGPNATLSADGRSCTGQDFAGLAPSCGANMTLNAGTNTCELTTAACLDGTVLNATKTACQANIDHGSLVAGPFMSDKVWSFLRYNNGTSLVPLGDDYHRTGTPADPATADIYINFNPANGGPSTPDSNPRMGAAPVDTTDDTTRIAGGWPVYWDANPANPSSTPSAFDHYIKVSEWDNCTQTWAIYKDPPGIGGKKYYRLVVDYAGCPPNASFEHWFNYGNGANGAMRILGTPAGGLPNSIMIQANGTAHWERDFNPEIWTKSDVALNGNTHGGQMGTGRTPNLSVSANASFWIATFFHNSGQSNGNAGWCMPDPTVPTICGIPDYVGGNAAGTNGVMAANVPAYIYLPGKVGFESFPAFAGGATPNVTNAAPLSALQPYTN
jgi:hypothetical protein